MFRFLQASAVFCGCLVTCALAQQVDQEQAAKGPMNIFEGSAEAAYQGHTLFNENCSHCHGPNAVTGMSERNLRKLQARYGADMPLVFRTTVLNGRADKGMPSWQGVLDEKTIWQIYTYLETVQVDAD
jgi:polar amino acid transport system substrate-binding protein